MKIDPRKFANGLFVGVISILLGLFIFAALSFAPSPAPEPPTAPGSSIERIGTMGYDTKAYKITVDGLTFLVVNDGNKGGVAVTRIK